MSLLNPHSCPANLCWYFPPYYPHQYSVTSSMEWWQQLYVWPGNCGWGVRVFVDDDCSKMSGYILVLYTRMVWVHAWVCELEAPSETKWNNWSLWFHQLKYIIVIKIYQKTKQNLKKNIYNTNVSRHYNNNMIKSWDTQQSFTLPFETSVFPL